MNQLFPLLAVGLVSVVSINSHAGEPCILKLDFHPDRVEGIAKSAVKNLPDGRFEVDLKQGEEAIFYGKNVATANIVPVKALPEDANTFGLH